MSTTTNAPTTFNPSTFFSDYSQFNPQYTTDPNTSNTQLQALQNALSYVQSNPSLPNAAYLTHELNADIAEQQNIGNYDTAQNAVNTLPGQINNWQSLLSSQAQNTAQLGGGSLQDQMNWVKANAPDAWNSAQVQNSLQYQGIDPEQVRNAMLQAVQSSLTNDINNAQTQLTNNQGNIQNAQSALLNGTTLTSPDYGTELKNIQQYYYGGNGQPGQITLATQPAISSIYQANYNDREGINQQMAASGNLSSGVRQKALADQNSSAINQAAQVVANAQGQAQQNMANLNQQNQQQTAAQTDLLNSLKQGGASNLLSGATNSAIQAYDTNAAAQMQSGIAGAETALQQQQANNGLNTNILSQFGQGLGTMAGGSLSNPFGMFASNFGATI